MSKVSDKNQTKNNYKVLAVLFGDCTKFRTNPQCMGCYVPELYDFSYKTAVYGLLRA